MNKTINERELRNASAAGLREVRRGHTIIGTRKGDPIDELRPIHPRRFASTAVIAEAVSRASRVDAVRFRNDVEGTIDQSVDG